MAIGLIAPGGRVVSISTAPITLTTEYQKIGSRILTKNSDGLVFWLDLDINDSTGIEFRAVAFHSQDDDSEYSFPTEEIFTGINKIYPKYYEVQKLEDQKIMFQVTTAKAIPYIEIQIRAAELGATPAILNSLMCSEVGEQT